MTCRGIGLIVFILLFTGCASVEGPRWALLGDTSEHAFFLDRHDVQRMPGGNYSYTVKIWPYEESHPHSLEENRDTNRLLFIEMDCLGKQWTETGCAIMENNGKILFRILTPAQGARPVEPGTIHMAAYTYLCDDGDITAQHDHRQ